MPCCLTGVEYYHGTPILYSCGDFIDDYRIDDDYRNDLTFLFELHADVAPADVAPADVAPADVASADLAAADVSKSGVMLRPGRVQWNRLCLYPSRIQQMQATGVVPFSDRR